MPNREDPVDVRASLEDSIFELSTIEDVYDIRLARSRVAEVLEKLRLALAELKREEARRVARWERNCLRRLAPSTE
jgi:hypothetical protein